ncbi:MAG: ComEC/Rec2 family competence protein [Candidatus Magasanikbacteria bacterium]|nr:ComEC/Rec2 family competence protein [Candidatus Magasanikbacteria bacterium]
MKLSNSKMFIFCCLAFIAGIGSASFLPVQYLRFDLDLFILVIIFLILSVIFWNNKNFRLINLISLFLFLGIWRYSIFLPVNSADKIWFYNNHEAEFVGMVSEETTINGGKQKITVETETDEGHRVSGKVLLTTEAYPQYAYGDRLKIQCDLKAPEPIEDFSYDRYLARYDIYSVCYYPKIKLLNQNNGNYFYEKLLNLKTKIRTTIIQGSREPYSGIFQATLLGGNASISKDLQTLFAQAGISHIIAISGMHISVVVIVLMWLLINLGLTRKTAFYVIILILFIYMAMISFMASAVRSALMGFLVLWAMYLGRFNKIMNSLILGATILLAFNPRLFRDDIGFQLSFLALLGMIWLFPLGQAWADKKRISAKYGIRDAIILTLSAQVFTTPVIAYNFSQVSLISPLVNLLVVWTSPFILIFLMVAVILSLVFPFLSVFLFFPTELIFVYMIKVSEVLLKIPFSNIKF